MELPQKWLQKPTIKDEWGQRESLMFWVLDDINDPVISDNC